MKQAKRGQVTIALTALGLAAATLAVWAGRPGAVERDFPGGVRVICLSPACGQRFVVPLAELTAAERREPGAVVACPKCGGAETARALACPSCGAWFEAPRERTSTPKCPACGQVVKKLTE